MAGGGDAFAAEGQCTWVRADGFGLSQDSSQTYTGFDARTYNIEGGTQFAPTTDWRVGVAGGFANTSITEDGGATSRGTIGEAGVVAKYQPGDLLLAGSLSGTYGWYDSTRDVSFGGFSDQLTGSNGDATLNARMRVAYTLHSDDLYLRPQVDLNATYARTGEFTESGGPAAMTIAADDHTAFSISPSVEVGGQMILDDDSVLRPYLQAGATVSTGNDYSLRGTFAADTDGSDPFTVASSSDRVVFNLSGGVDLLRSEGETGARLLRHLAG